MRLRHFVQSCAAGIALAVAAPALGQDRPVPGAPPPGPDMRPEWTGAAAGHPPRPPMIADRARENWLMECRRRISPRDDGVGGAVIGGVLGGVAGNRIAGRGNRTVGTVAGAAVGAVAGAAIDKAEDRGRIRDECETYLDDYNAYYSQGGYAYGQPGYGYPAYGQGACCQPMTMVPAYRPSPPECTETVEYVYEDVPVRPKARRIPSKRVKVVPDKRVRVN